MSTVSRENIFHFLQAHHVGVLSTVHEDGSADGATIYYLCDDELKFIFPSRKGMQKYKNILKNDSVCITVTDAEKQITVKIRGKAADVGSDSSYMKRLVEHLSLYLTNTSTLPFLKHAGSESTVLQVVPTEILFRRYHDKGFDEGYLSF